MKSLKNYIYESFGVKDADSKKDVKDAEPIENLNIKFSFKDLEEGENTKKELVEIAQRNGISFENDDDNLSIEFNLGANDNESAKEIINVLSTYTNKIRNSQKRSNDEQYAQKTISFEKKFKELKSYFEKAKSNEEE